MGLDAGMDPSLGCVAVVVTYNRLELLKKTLKGIRAQTCPLDAIVVVNNGSNDGTREWLEQQRELTVINQENVGGAGGFKQGMQHAFEQGAEWIWVMDDDVIPERNTLERLLARHGISHCLMPTRNYSDGSRCEWGHVFDLRKRSVVFGSRPREQDEGKEFVFVNTCCFEGMLIHRSIIEKVGFPDERFFLSWDDTVYGLMVSRVTNPVVVRDALMVRAKTAHEARRISPVFSYYHFRNFHLVEEYYRTLSGGEGYGIRGHLKYVAGSFLFLRKCWKSSRDTFFPVFKAVFRGMRDSYRGTTGCSH